MYPSLKESLWLFPSLPILRWLRLAVPGALSVVRLRVSVMMATAIINQTAF